MGAVMTLLGQACASSGDQGSPDWRYRALCVQVDPDLFFPEPMNYVKIRHAKRICQVCDVRAECLEYALVHDESGIWGGMSERERRRLKRNIA
jgi:WhiB family transcriptional regulator, redox-sensing transcriptional regulator